jgi:pimeloyl-ACP methyl ester carboxylesterase
MFLNLAARARTACLLLGILGLSAASVALADEPKGTAKPAATEPAAAVKPPRRVYVLHSGLHTILSDPVKNIAAQKIREGLHKRGVADKDLVVLDNPFPTASWKSLFPFQGFTMFFDSIEPSSRVSHEAYRRLHKALEAQGVDVKDDVVWVGHSAGGQIGLTMAHLGRNLGKYPELAKEAVAYHVDMVITLGAPVGSNHLPPDVKLRHYYSADDRVVRWVSRVGPWVGYPLGYRTRLSKVPASLGENCMIRCFGEVEHPSWDVEGRVLDRILGEAVADFRPLWHSQLPLARWGLSLSELLCRGLEDECHISVEDPPKNK